MNIETTNAKNNINETQKTNSKKVNKDSSANFAEELKILDKTNIEPENPTTEELKKVSETDLLNSSTNTVDETISSEKTDVKTEENSKVQESIIENNILKPNFNDKKTDVKINKTLDNLKDKNIYSKNDSTNKNFVENKNNFETSNSVNSKNIEKNNHIKENIFEKKPIEKIQMQTNEELNKGIENIGDESVDKAIESLNNLVNEFNQPEDNKVELIHKEDKTTEKLNDLVKEFNQSDENKVEFIHKEDKTTENLNDLVKEFNQSEENKVELIHKEDRTTEKLNNLVNEFNQSDEKKIDLIKKEDKITDKQDMINNDFNIQENKEVLPQMSLNMGFSGDGQPFSSFMNDSQQNDSKNQKNVLQSTAQDLAEEAAILSTMAENIAIANRNQMNLKDKPFLAEKNITQKQIHVENKNLTEQPIIIDNTEQIVIRNDGIKKVDTETGITQEVIVKFDNIVMNEADVEVFSQLVQQNEINIKDLTSQVTEKSINISKTLADMLAKSMENNQPLRIDFDNNISVIIRINREGKISADFLPSSQVAEAYLKENLPLLKQKFDENNIKYEDLNQRERRDQKDNNRKKGRNNE